MVALSLGTVLTLAPILSAQTGADLRLPAGREWLTVSGSWTNARYAALDQINPSTINALNGAWMQRLRSGIGARFSQQATPLVKDGVMYVPTGEHDVFALNARTGEILIRSAGSLQRCPLVEHQICGPGQPSRPSDLFRGSGDKRRSNRTLALHNRPADN